MRGLPKGKARGGRDKRITKRKGERRQRLEDYQSERLEEADMTGLLKRKATGGRDERITKVKG
jgi:hypothetical protein